MRAVLVALVVSLSIVAIGCGSESADEGAAPGSFEEAVADHVGIETTSCTRTDRVAEGLPVYNCGFDGDAEGCFTVAPDAEIFAVEQYYGGENCPTREESVQVAAEPDETDETETGSSADECESVEAPAAREETREAPTEPLADGTTYELVFDTSCGSFTITLDQELAPKTAPSLVALAESGYYDDTIFHRVVPDFVIQGGDPTQSGGGGPGYQTVDPPPGDSRYTKGIVAMAKGQTEPAGTSGSQFFVVTGANAAVLTPDYAIVGEVTEGMETIDRIAALGVTDGPPSMPVLVRTVTVSES